MPDDRWFLRKSGKVTGPFTRVQLDGLRRRGQLSQFHEASQDRQIWASATSIPGLFPDTGAVAGAQDAMSGYAPAYGVREEPQGFIPAPPGRSDWHYNDASATFGPVGQDHISTLVAIGRLNAESQVWKEGMAAWMPLRQVPEFAAQVAQAPTGAASYPGLGIETDPQESGGKAGKTRGYNSLLIGVSAISILAVAGLLVAFTMKGSGGFSLSTAVGTPYINAHDRSDIPNAVGLVLWGVTATNTRTGLLREIPAFRGSCFQVSPNGYLLTNKHVVEKYEEATRSELTIKEQEEKGFKMVPKLWVFLAGVKYDAKVIHTSGKFDLAVLKIDYHDNRQRPYFRLKAVPQLRQTTPVYALGFPAAVSMNLSLGENKEVTEKLSERVESTLKDSDLRYSITSGIISLVRSEQEIEYIIHGAQISGGNSGGPLIDQGGNVLGINTFYTRVEESKGETIKNYYAVSFSQMIAELEKKVPQILK